MYVELCESIVRYNYYYEYHKENVTRFILFFSIRTVAGSGYYGIESPFPYMRNFFFGLLSAASWLSRATDSQNDF